MVRKHITRDYSQHEKSIIRPDDDYIMFEVFAFDPAFTKTFSVAKKQFNKVNTKLVTWKAWSAYRSQDPKKSMVVSFNYNFKEEGVYHIEFIYEKNTGIYTGTENKYNSWKNINGLFEAIKGDKTTYKQNITFYGENNMTKRVHIVQHFNKSTQKLRLTIPPNCYFMGAIVRKEKYLFGDNLDSAGSTLQFTNATLTNSDMAKPSELSITIGYDDDFECLESPSGFYIDYMNECNLYVKDEKGKNVRIFGGYISTISADNDRTKLTINCADRLRDGTNKYILDELILQGGTKDIKENEYSGTMERNFESYAHALQYLCGCHETFLKCNIGKTHLVQGEKYREGVVLTFGRNKSIKSIVSSNGMVDSKKNFITIRNNNRSDKEQTFDLYIGKDHAKLPLDITNYPYFHITYGLGEPVTEIQSKETNVVDGNGGGGQKFSKCGVSADGKYVMAIGTVSSARDSGSYGTLYKTVFKNKCPHCGAAKLVWDSCRSNTKCVFTMGWGGSKRRWGVPANETEITCNSCDSDYSAMGNEKDSPWKKLTKVSPTVKSSQSEQNKLANGNMVAVPSSGQGFSADDILTNVAKIAYKYSYRVGGGVSTYSAMKKAGYGDCWAFSDLLFTEIKKYKVGVRIVQYATQYSDNHRSVQYKNDKGQWVDFPYRKTLGGTSFAKRYNNMLNNTSASAHGTAVNTYNGGSIGSATGGSTSSSETTTVTTRNGYDKDKPIQGYFEITYSTKQSWNAPKQKIYIDFTQKSKLYRSISGLPAYWINKNQRQSTLQTNIIDYIHLNINSNERVYLHSVRFITPALPQKQGEDNDWYKNDKSTIDNASCKMDLYQISFNDNKSVNPSELNSCGKTVNALLGEVVKDSGYLVKMEYGKYRKDDVVHFRLDNDTKTKFHATEGDNNNILSWNSINYNPLSTMFNCSMQVFKNFKDKYEYATTLDVDSIFKYQEQTTLATSSDAISSREAYWNAIHSEKYNPVQTYNYSIVVPNFVNLQIGDMVKVTANSRKLNTIKTVESVKVTYSISQIPRIKTEIGLGELDPDLQMKENIKKLRQNAKKETTYFGSSATPVSDLEVYAWDH